MEGRNAKAWSGRRVVTAAVVIGLAGVVLRVREAAADPFVSSVSEGMLARHERCAPWPQN
jgi:hypothetical protein